MGSKVPFGKFSPSFPGQVVDGTEDLGKVFAIRSRPAAACLFYFFVEWDIVAAARFLWMLSEITSNCIGITSGLWPRQYPPFYLAKETISF